MAFTSLLLVALVLGAMQLQPAITGGPAPTLRILVIATLLPLFTLIILGVLERVLPPAGPRKPFGRWLLHMQVTIFFSMLVGLSVVLASRALAATAHSMGFELGLIDLRFTDGTDLLQILGASWLAAIVGDFFFYWYHRALHTFPWLWAHHKLHHMDTELEAISLARQNWVEVVFAALFIVIPTALLFKFDPLDPWKLGLVSGVAATVFGTLLVIGHANFRLQVGWASVLWCSPQVHRIHHSRLPQHQDKNFAFTLPLWDALFGTYYAPKKNEFPPTGVDGETEIETFWESQIFSQREWWRMWRERPPKRQTNVVNG